MNRSLMAALRSRRSLSLFSESALRRTYVEVFLMWSGLGYDGLEDVLATIRRELEVRRG